MNKQYDYRAAERAAQELWQQNTIYRYAPEAGQEKYTIDTPPPTVSGSLHIGHVFSYTHTDIIARYERMLGKAVFYPMGFDDNGLATERFVEKTHSIRAHHLSRSEFIALCLRETARVEHEFEALWRALGLSIDWSKTYSTIAPNARAAAQKSFLDLYQKELVYRKKEPSIYCTTCRTSISQADLESVEQASTFNDIVFTAHDGSLISIATTRPEMLAACVAVLCHPADTRYRHLVGTNLVTPLYQKSVPVLTDETVDMAKGTGIVMCCTFGDGHDIAWFKKHRLPHIQVIGLDGKLTGAAGPLVGMNVIDARRTMLELLKEHNALLAQRHITHAVQVHERCKQSVEYQILTQWFISILAHKQALLARADQIRWFPAFMKSRYQDWVENLSWDWCISRQRFFGIPFPVWHCNDCGAVLTPPESMLPIDPQETAFPGGRCENCRSTSISPDTDVMDTWNTSSLTPQINQATTPDITRPMSLRPQAHDIIRTWAFYTIAKAHYHDNTIPWRDIVISGHVLSGKEKISKSQGGSKTTPQGLLEQYPADAIRYWAASGGPGVDTALSENQFKVGLRLITKLWNAAQFCAQHMQTVEESAAPAAQSATHPLNQWIRHEFARCLDQYMRAFEEYEYHHALQIAESFLYQTFCDNYLELAKDILFNPDKYTTDLARETRATLKEMLFGQLQLLAPYIPHITETIYQDLFRATEHATSLHISRLDSNRFAMQDQASATLMHDVLNVVAQVRKHKSLHALSLKTQLQKLIICCADAARRQAVARQHVLIAGITHAIDIEFCERTPAESTSETIAIVTV